MKNLYPICVMHVGVKLRTTNVQYNAKVIVLLGFTPSVP